MTTVAPTALQELISDQFSLDAPLSLMERAAMLREVIDCVADLNAVRAELEDSLASDMEADNLPTPFGTLVRQQGGRRSNWDGEAVIRRIVKRFPSGADPETGELLEPDTLAARVAEDLAECGGLKRPSHNWRAGELKRRSIPLSDVCDYVEGKVSVRFA